MERIDPEKILEQHIKNNPENSEKMQKHLDEDNLAFHDENFDLKEAERNIPEIMGSVTEDKEEIKSKQYEEVREKIETFDIKFIELAEKIKDVNIAIQSIQNMKGVLDGRSRIFNLEFLTESGINSEVSEDQIQHVDESLDKLINSLEIKNKELDVLIQDLNKTRKTIEVMKGILSPNVLEGENLNRYEMN